MKKALVLVAGGSGIRMGGVIPKQYLELAGKPLIIHVLEAFLLFDPSMEVVVVMAPSHKNYWNALGEKYAMTRDMLVTEGGATRYESVRNGLARVAEDRIVGIHDAVRPLVSQETLERTYASASEWGSGIPVISMEDSVRMLDENNGSSRVDRNRLRRVQTPQVFHSEQIKEAYQEFQDPAFTDDASVYESKFGQLRLVEGNRENIKITTPADMKLAEALIQSGA